jgi:hypothetical protein
VLLSLPHKKHNGGAAPFLYYLAAAVVTVAGFEQSAGSKRN